MPFARSRGCRIFYELSGATDRPALTLIRGLGRSGRYWSPIVPLLERDFLLVVVDNRGVGRSDTPPPPYSTSAMADDVVAVLDDAGIERTHAFGMSLGGMIAQQLALRHGYRIDRLILGCTSCGGRRAHTAWRSLLAILRAGRMSPRQAAYFSAAYLLSAETLEAHPERVDAWAGFAEADGASRLGALGQLSAAVRHRSYETLPNIDVPTLVITGDADRLIPSSNSELLTDRIPGACLELLRDAGHDFTTDRPEVAAAAIRRFLLGAMSAEDRP